tara:strand:+ start:118 stop:576 length:459 start_codon:yes stop_codon:yes gene_type:complete
MREWHYLLPRELGGTDSDDNYVLLASKPHADAHMDLFRRYGNGNDLNEYRRLMALHEAEQRVVSPPTASPTTTGHKSKGVPKKPEHRKAISLAKKGQYVSDEHRAKISATMKGNKNSAKHSTEEYKARHSNRMKEAWVDRKARMEALWNENG